MPPADAQRPRRRPRRKPSAPRSLGQAHERPTPRPAPRPAAAIPGLGAVIRHRPAPRPAPRPPSRAPRHRAASDFIPGLGQAQRASRGERVRNLPEPRPEPRGLHLKPGYRFGRVDRHGRAPIINPRGQTVGHSQHVLSRSERRADVAGKLAPALVVLNQTTRPLHAVAGAARADVKTAQDRGLAHYLIHGGGTQALTATARGIQNKDQFTFSDVLKQAGVRNKAVRAVGGFGLDVALDPVTYVGGATGGIGSALAAPVVDRASSTAPGRLLRNLARDVNPNIAPEGVSKQAWSEATSAARTARATTGRKLHETQQRALAIRKTLGKDDNRVTDAIERNNIQGLPEHLKPPAISLRSHYRYIRRLEKQAGIRGGTRQNYVPHYTVQSLEERAPSEEIRTTGSVGKRVIRPASSKARTREGTLAEKLMQYPGEYNEDAALAYLNRVASGHRDVTQAQLNRRIADDLGRAVKPGRPIELADNEQVFHLKGSDLNAVNDKRELAKIAERGHAGKGGRYVVLNKDVVAHAHAISRPGGSRSEIGKRYDQLQGGFKLLATQPNPAFHIRNFVGDVQNAYLGQSAFALPGNLARSQKALRALGRQEVAQRTLGKAARPVRGTVKVGNKRMTYEELANEAAHVGAIRSGFTARELHDLIQAEGQGTRKVTRSAAGRATRAAGEKVKRVVQGREDMPRLATYIAARKRGLGPEAAAREAAKFHFDYANLSEFERKYARRALPFYTFTARNVPLQVRSLLTRPGKYSNYEKIREEAGKAAGMQPGWEKGQPEYQQRQAGIPVSWKGHKFTLNVGGLPLTDINEFPAAAGGPIAQADEFMQRGASMVSPIIKDPVELWANYSTFFRDQIRRPNAPLVAAPSFVGRFPPEWKKRFHVAKIEDKRTGKMIWGWDAKVDYVSKAINPGLGTALLGLTSGTGRQGQGPAEKAIGLSGVRPTPYDPVTTEINNSYKRLDKIQTQLAGLGQQGVHSKDDARRAELNAEARALERRIFQLSKKRGDKKLPKRGGPKKPRRSGSGGGVPGFDAGSGGGVPGFSTGAGGGVTGFS
jgi:hypothetical protein